MQTSAAKAALFIRSFDGMAEAMPFQIYLEQSPSNFTYGSLSTTQSFLPVSTRIISEDLRVRCDAPAVTNTTGKL